MDRHDTLRNLLIAAGVFLLVMAVAPRILPTAPQRPPVDAGVSPTDLGRSASSGSGDGSEMRDAAGAGAAGDWSIDQAAEEQTRRLGATLEHDGDPTRSPYRMGVEITNLGASVSRARLTDHAARLGEPERYELLRPIERPDGRVFRSLAVEKVNVDGRDLPLGDALWHIGDVQAIDSAASDGGDADGSTVTLWIDLLHAGQPALRLTRVFTLPAQSVASRRHDLRVDLLVENLSSQPREVLLTYRGGLGLPQESTRMDDHVIDLGLLQSGGRVVGTRKNATEAARDGGSTINLYQFGGHDAARFAWVATGNTYFTCTIAPLDKEGQESPNYITAVKALDLDPANGRTDDVTTQFVTAKRRLDPGTVVSYPAEVYLGEKDPRGFRKVSDYDRRNYYFQIEAGFGWCTFSVLVRLMIWLLNVLHVVVPDYGVAIIVLVLIVRTLLHPITKAGQVNMVRMQQKMGEFAPKLEELKRRYGNDKAKLQQETMKLYREHNVNPAGNLLGCLPLFIQMPIWVALFLSLSNNIHMRHEGFLFTWVRDLTAPDALIPFSSPLTVPIFGWQIAAFNLLPPLVSLFMYLQQKSQPRPKPNPNLTDEQRAQQEMMLKIMPIMSIMMLFFFYNAPSGLNLYIMFSSLFGWIEQKRIRDHIKQREEAGTLHKPARPAEEPRVKKRPGELSFFEKLQKMAEDAQKAQAKRRRPKKGEL